MLRGADLVLSDEFVACLNFIHDEFFTDLEAAMNSVVEALIIFEEKCK